MSFTPPKSLPDGPWQAKVTMVSGLTVSTRTETIQFGALVASQAGLPMMAWAGIAVVLVLVIAFFVVRRARRHRHVPA